MKATKMERLVELLARWVKLRKTGKVIVTFNQGGIRKVEKHETDELEE